MSGERLPNDFSSTPLKDFHPSKDFGDGILSDEEDTFSLLSPIYHDSFDSDEEELRSTPDQQTTSPRERDDSRLSISPFRCELPKAISEQPAASPTLSAWEMWLVNKAKEERLKQEKKVEKEHLLKERKEKQEREQEQKKLIMENKIQEWLKLKTEQERHEQLLKQRKEEEEMQRQQERRRETEQKAQQKYKDWLQRKNQEKIEKEKKEKEEASLKEEQEMERRRRAEEKFKEWLAKANEKSKASPKKPSYPSSPYDKSYPSPSFVNPIPWKPIHVPPPEPSSLETSSKKPLKQRKSQQSLSNTFRLRNTQSPAHLQQKR
ncbi:coiled-coil domain-containing protein 34 [Pundamilia nyererei]|uniref:Coiled-coil domain-containing protein 34-like n=1 Tax=Pundamilia nyererei TaxID=303518 RepID=A0A9Y3VHQ0_9CICH|nr:PREDICTED: coiled-coil domain-containing protein 34-like [Pundamilia nyererei]XP_005734923.1 PREDICTED: coiled-coil domain-containing protein 34-like [Pundamilia nyererei]